VLKIQDFLPSHADSLELMSNSLKKIDFVPAESRAAQLATHDRHHAGGIISIRKPDSVQTPDGSSASSMKDAMSERNAFSVLVIVVCGIAGLFVCLWTAQYSDYLPWGDDPALLVTSSQIANASDWFARGLSRDFQVYPEWGSSQSDYVRPFANLILFVDGKLFRRKFGLFFLSLYFAQSLLVIFVYLVLRRLDVPAPARAGLVALAAINPAFMDAGLFALAFQFDVWGGALVLCSFFAVLSEYYAAGFLALLVAIFTKETTLFAPIAAAFTVLLLDRRKSRALLMVLPLVIWTFVRFGVFKGSLTGAGLTSSPPTIFLNIILGALVWPTGALNWFDIGPLKALGTGYDAVNALLYFAISLNCILWLWIAARLWNLRYAFIASCKGRASKSETEELIAVVWFLGALGIGLLAAQEPRYGGSIDPLLLILLGVGLFRNNSERKNVIAGSAVAASLAVLYLSHAARTFELFRGRAVQQVEASLREAVVGLPAQIKTVYVVNAPDVFSSPRFLSAFWQIPQQLVYLNQFGGCTRANGQTPLFSIQPNAVNIDAFVPSCAMLVFNEVNSSRLIGGLEGVADRARLAAYKFPDGKIIGHAIRDPKQVKLVLGQEVSIRLRPGPYPYAIAYYDWSSGRYRIFEPQ